MDITTMPIVPHVCDSCIDAVVQEGEEMGLDMEWDEAAGYARELGADIADHLCDGRENGTACDCACRRYETRQRRH